MDKLETKDAVLLLFGTNNLRLNKVSWDEYGIMYDFFWSGRRYMLIQLHEGEFQLNRIDLTYPFKKEKLEDKLTITLKRLA